MPLPLPNLDDRRYTDLVEEARALIPAYAPEWTNHNPSDPGITLIELFAALSEMLIYRLNRVTPANVISFLKILNGPDWPRGKRPEELTAEELAQEVPATIQRLRRRARAVTPEDFESLARENPDVARALCLPNVNLGVDSEQPRPGHVTVVVVPCERAQGRLPEILGAVKRALTPTLLLTTQLHVVEPRLVTIGVTVRVVAFADQPAPSVKARVVTAVRDFLAPVSAAEAGGGWPFGRNVFVSELFALLDRLPGIDYVEAIALTPAAPDRLITSDGDVVGVELRPHELVDVQIAPRDVTVNGSLGRRLDAGQESNNRGA